MIFINGREVKINKFPDGTLRLNPDIMFVHNQSDCQSFITPLENAPADCKLAIDLQVRNDR